MSRWVERVGILDFLKGRPEAGAGEAAGLFDQGIRDATDPRTIGESPDLNQAIQAYQGPENVEKAEAFVFDGEIRRAPDFYLPYYWAATARFDRGNVEEAKKILHEGIARCRIKSVLCRRLGEFLFLSGDVEGALYWLFTTTFADTGSIDYHAYLYLAYLFEAYGMPKAGAWALRRARGISYKLLLQAAEYSARKKERILEIARAHRSDAVAKMLADYYRYAEPTIRPL